MTDDATVMATAPPGGTAVATSSPGVETTRTVEHGAASDLPETNWTWRRWFVWAVTIFACALLWRITERVTDITTLREAVRYLCGIIVLILTLYLAGASAEKMVQIISAVRTTRRETVTTTPAGATT